MGAELSLDPTICYSIYVMTMAIRFFIEIVIVFMEGALLECYIVAVRVYVGRECCSGCFHENKCFCHCC